MASDQIVVKVRARGVWRAKLALRLCSLALRLTPRAWTYPLCRAALWLSWFRIDFDIAGKRSHSRARLTATKREAE